MRRNFTSPETLRLLKAATVLSIGGILAGCSSDVVRFNDGFYTGAIPTQAEAQAQSPASYGQPNYNPGIDRSTTGSIPAQSVERVALPRPGDSSTPAPHPVGTVSAAAPTYTAPAGVSPMTTASVAPAPERFNVTSPAAPSGAAGWSTANATQVVVRNGETIDTLAKRYGVPGQAILIPSYSQAGATTASITPAKPATQAAAQMPQPQLRPATQTAAAAAAPSRDAVIAAGGKYTVAAGDTLSSISRRTGASVAAIKQVNSMTTDTVRIGQKLIIPGLQASAGGQVAMAKKVDPITTSSVQQAPAKPAPAAPAAQVTGYTPPTQSAKTSTSGSITTIETQETASAPDATGVASLRWPVQGRIVGAFGSNNSGKPNDGIDISVPEGTPVKAAENGVVIYAGDGLKELGKTVLVRHENGIVTVYGHVSGIDVKRGDTVKRGQQIASSGMSGAAKQPQLHFEVRKNSTPVNPVTYLQ